MKKIYSLLAACLIVSLVSLNCKKPYEPKAIESPSSFLVVEGVINAGSDSTIIKINRTVNIASLSTVNPEKGAKVSVESDANVSYSLTETAKGQYVTTSLNLDTSSKYRLRIQTGNQQVYLSDFEIVKLTPPIDSIGFNITNKGLQLYVNAHDAKNNTHYYRWDYVENWQFNARYPSVLITNGTSLITRPQDKLIYSCFATDSSSNIILGSSAKLSQDVIYQHLISTIDSTSEKFESQYSILLKQYALTVDSYSFWTNLQKNTEKLGSIFDAQPSNTVSNIHNINNPAEQVVGYISVCTVQSKRIFIPHRIVPKSWVPTYPYDCQADTFSGSQIAALLIPLNSNYLPITQAFPGDGILASSRECIDCTLRGEINPPAFWKYNYSSF